MKINERTFSRLLGIGVVLLVGALLFNYFRSVNKVDREQTSSDQTEVKSSEGEVPTGEQLPGTYTVKAGDNLWKIAEKAYGSGYNWTDIYKENMGSLSDPNKLEIGMKLDLPKAELKVVTHQISKGETLWGLAGTYCGSGWEWQKLAAANDITDPRRLEIGRMLTIACR
ncbi:LysM peptidoglycan-binding domain-containing protein [Candidatus Amesbacteria bacterium]|nr:LysM peptidoglycan-binding domain-containing protein [Candidatus Amesbacteria bacterium]